MHKVAGLSAYNKSQTKKPPDWVVFVLALMDGIEPLKHREPSPVFFKITNSEIVPNGTVKSSGFALR